MRSASLNILLTSMCLWSAQAQAQVLNQNEVWNGYLKGVSQIHATNQDPLECTIQWDNLVYAYGLELISPDMEAGLPPNLKLLSARTLRDKWIIRLEIEADLTADEAWERVNGPSNFATLADQDMDSVFYGEPEATRRVFTTLGRCSQP
ncbi:MAG: hypothetical protein CMK07_02490 [Ponticaulis sp.]|nr:hypothetical protein [Ponticaulis sp.]